MKKILAIQLITALVGTVYAYYNVFWDFVLYKNNCGSLFPVTTTFTHPFFTPCFYGAFAFLITLVISIFIFKTTSLKLQKYLISLSAFGVAFAWGNMALEIKKYLQAGSVAYKGCSGAVVSNPLFTPCFGGSVIFVILLLVSLYTFRKLKKKTML